MYIFFEMHACICVSVHKQTEFSQVAKAALAAAAAVHFVSNISRILALATRARRLRPAFIHFIRRERENSFHSLFAINRPILIIFSLFI